MLQKVTADFCRYIIWKKMIYDKKLSIVLMVNDKLTCIAFGVKNIQKNVQMKK